MKQFYTVWELKFKNYKGLGSPSPYLSIKKERKENE